MVVRNECDLALGSFSITHGRYQAVDFSVGFYEETKTILIPPPTTESRLFECIRPFHWQVIIINYFYNILNLDIHINVTCCVSWFYIKTLFQNFVYMDRFGLAFSFPCQSSHWRFGSLLKNTNDNGPIQR